ISRAVVTVSKCDLVSREEAELVAAEAIDLLEGRIGVCAPAFLTSTTDGQGIDALREALLALTTRQHERPLDGQAWLPIDRAFSMAGHGPVVTGTLRGAPLAAGDVLDLL